VPPPLAGMAQEQKPRGQLPRGFFSATAGGDGVSGRDGWRRLTAAFVAARCLTCVNTQTLLAKQYEN
jgi:hypothetical protein